MCQKIILKCDYNLIGKLQYEIQEKNDIIIGDTTYGEDVTTYVFVPCDNVESFINNIIDKTNGNVHITKSEIGYFEKNE